MSEGMSEKTGVTANGGQAKSCLASAAQPQPPASAGSEGSFGGGELVSVVIETPRGSRVKYKFDEELQALRLKSVLPQGMVFPFNFGFVPQTTGGDGDPLDALLLMDEALVPGCVATVRLIGVMVVEQTIDGELQRNDRLLAVADTGDAYSRYVSVKDVPRQILEGVDAFFVQYHQLAGKTSRTLASKGPEAARDILQSAAETWKAENGRGTPK